MKDAKRNERESYETPEVLDIKPVTTCKVQGVGSPDDPDENDMGEG